MAIGLGDDSVSPEAKRAVLRAMARSGLKTMPPVWVGALARLLDRGDKPLIADAVAAARALPAPKDGGGELHERLVQVAQRDEEAVGVRLELTSTSGNSCFSSFNPASVTRVFLRRSDRSLVKPFRRSKPASVICRPPSDKSSS